MQPPGKLPKYMHRRGRFYYFKRKIPADLMHVFGDGRDQMWKALGTSLFEKAKVMLAVEVSEFDFAVAKHRRQLAAKSAGVPVRVNVPKESDASEAVDVALTPDQQAHMALVRGIEESLQKLMAMMPGGSGLAGVNTVMKTAPAIALPASARAKVQGTNERAKPVTQISTDPNYGARKPTLLHLYEDWRLKQTRERSAKTMLRTVHEFRDIHGSLAVESITRQHARDYRDLLIERGLAKDTVANKIGYLATLVRHGMMEIVEDLQRNPFEKIAVSGGAGLRPKKNRRAYTITELNQIFAGGLYTGELRVKGQLLEAAYWLPLLGPFVGARIEEICQLRVEDVQRINGVWCLRICDLDEDQKLKNDGSFRRVPLHEDVIRCGFLRHAAQMKLAGHERLFPSLRNDNENGVYSNAPGKWFGRYLDSVGLSDHRLDYHSYRYFFRQQCSLCGVEEEPRDALTGHWVGKSDSGRAYMKGENAQYPFPKLVDAIGRLRYDDLRISHLHIANPMHGVVETLIEGT
jgi:integrase